MGRSVYTTTGIRRFQWYLQPVMSPGARQGVDTFEGTMPITLTADMFV